MVNMALLKVTYQNQQLLVASDRRAGPEHLVLFLHGLGCTRASFQDALTFQGLNAFAIMTCDFIGYGGSSKPANFSYTLEGQATIISNILEQIKPERISVVGHSMGGAIGLLVAKKLSNLVSFISIEGNLVAQDCGLVSRGIANQTLDEFVNNGYQVFLKSLQTSKRPDFIKWAEWYAQSSPEALYHSAKSLVGWSDSGELLTIFNSLAKKAYIYGDEDSKDYLLPQLKETQKIMINDAGHFAMVDNPSKLYTNIVSILSQS